MFKLHKLKYIPYICVSHLENFVAHFAILHMMKSLKLILKQHVIYHKTQLAAQLTKYISVDVVLQYL